MRRILMSLGVLALAASLAGCSAQSGSTSSSQSEGSASAGSPVPAGGDAGVKGLASLQPDTGSRAVVTTGSVNLTVKDPTGSADRAARIVSAAGGRVEGRTEHAAQKSDAGSATLTLRIPSAVLDATVMQLRRLGTVENVSIASQDVTATSKDLDARITALRTSVARLVDLMSRASSTADLITIESALADRQSSLESLETQQRSLADQVDLATITLILGSVADRPKEAPANFLSGLVVGWGAIIAFLGGALVVLGVALPWLALAAIIAALVLGARRLRRRRPLRNPTPGSPS